MGWQPHLNTVASTCAAAFTLTNERSTPSLNRREPLYDTKSSPAININPAFSRQRTRTNPDYEEKESLKAEFDYDTSFQELLALKGARIRTKGRLVRLEKEWVAFRSRKTQ